MPDRLELARALDSAALNLHQAAEAYAEDLGHGDEATAEHMADLARYMEKVQAAWRAVEAEAR